MPRAVCARAMSMLGIAPQFVINEYGMTELCSQLYDATSFNSDDDSPPASGENRSAVDARGRGGSR